MYVCNTAGIIIIKIHDVTVWHSTNKQRDMINDRLQYNTVLYSYTDMVAILQESLWLVDMGLSYDEVEAVTSLHHVLDAWSSSPYAHDCRPEQGETEVGADPAQCGWISILPLLWQEWSQFLVENGCQLQVPHSAWGGEDLGACIYDSLSHLPQLNQHTLPP